MTNLLNQIGAHPFLAAGAVTGLAVAGYTGWSDYQAHKREGLEKNAARTLSTAGGALMIGATIPLGIYAAGRAGLGDNGMAARGVERFGKYIGNAFSKSFQAKSFKEALTHAAPVAAAAGGLIGAAIGGYVADDTGKGAVIGAGVGIVGGLAARAAWRGTSAWQALGKVPGARSAALILGAGAVVAGTRAMATPEYESTATAERDEQGGYQVSQTTVKDRVARMNATGDLVFGLHRSR